MDSNPKQDTYTMPLKQLLKLLETTADDAPPKRRRPRRRQDGKPAPALPRAEPDVFRF
jgi:hypothetical protein